MLNRAGVVGVFVAVISTLPGFAELQNVEVGGSMEIWGNWFTNFYESGDLGERIPPAWLRGRPIGPFGTLSPIRAYRRKGGSGLGYIEQRTTLHVNADFTHQVSAYFEVDSIEVWGEDFRSPNYLTGADQRADSSDDVEVHQAYLEIREIFETPLKLRLGRQEILLGSEWLVGNGHPCNPLTYLSFDAIRLSYEGEQVNVDAFASKLNERLGDFGKDDVDFYGLYATWSPLRELCIDAYWLFLHDGATVQDTAGSPAFEWGERLRGVDDYGHTQFHTLGLRTAGEWNHLDFEFEAAYQYGDAAGVGVGFPVNGHGDDSAWYNTWAGHGDIGYTFQVKFEPRVHVGGDYYGGEDRRHIDFLDWINPLYKPRASVSFNRLFSDWENDCFFDGSGMSNYWIARAGLSARPTEVLEVTFDVSYLQVVAPFDAPVMARFGSLRLPLGWPLSFITKNGARDLGYETTLTAAYQYSEELSLEAGWSHLFTGKALRDGAFVDQNGMGFFGGLSDDDADYFWLGTTFTF